MVSPVARCCRSTCSSRRGSWSCSRHGGCTGRSLGWRTYFHSLRLSWATPAVSHGGLVRVRRAWMGLQGRYWRIRRRWGMCIWS
uniref:Uncharacterized protein n=1 Tax=Arundo donax TaxID=35708 RepID=A0A0A9GXZ0_ARUDO